MELLQQSKFSDLSYEGAQLEKLKGAESMANFVVSYKIKGNTKVIVDKYLKMMVENAKSDKFQTQTLLQFSYYTLEPDVLCN